MDPPHPPKKPPPKLSLCPPPVVIPLRPKPQEHDDEQHHSHVLRAVVIVMACMVGMIMFLCAVSVLMKYFYPRRYNRNQNRRNTHTPILFDVNGDSPTSDNDDDVDDEEELAVVHPIWYIRTVGLQQSLIDSITVFKYKKDDGIIDGTECSVCLGEFEHDESLRLLPKCSHAFHIPCIDTWLRSHKNCPLCRAPVLRDAAQIRAVDQNNINNNQTEVNVSDHQSQNQEAHVEDSDVESGDLRSEDCDVEEGTQPLRRAVSVDSFSSSMFRDVVLDLDTHNQNGEKVNSRVKDNSNKGVSVGKNGSESSSSSGNVYKVGSSGRVMQKRTISMRRSFSHNRKLLFSRHYRSQSSTLPL